MRIFLLFLISWTTLSGISGQVIDFAPFPQSHFFKKIDRNSIEWQNKAAAGFNENTLDYRNAEPCPPEVSGNVVASGDSIVIVVDTFGMGKGDPATLSLLTTPAQVYGKASLSGVRLTYRANPGFNGLAEETVSLQYEEKGRREIITIRIKVKRKGRQVIAKPLTVVAKSVSKYCLGAELNFSAKRKCSQILGSSSQYDGKGNQSFHFSSYSFPDTCIVYYASRFPGRDTVSVRICDELAVCDTFLIPLLIRGDTLRGLPFFDDFSGSKGPSTSAKYWLDKNVFVNNSLAPNPPTIGFATFDGLDKKGNPYQVSSGPGDLLTSVPIDLSTYNTSNDVVLKFYLAPKGYGQAPELNDSVKVEFRNNQGRWVHMAGYKGLNNVSLDSFPAFVFRSIKLSDPQFFHKAFQFRFTAYTSPGGAVDLWHIDYVRLAANEGSGNTFPDVAFTKAPSSILKNYTSMPWWQFRGFEDRELQAKLHSGFFNHFDFQTALGSSNISFRETTSATNFNQNFTVVETGQDNNMAIKTHVNRERTIPAANFNGIKQVFTGIPPADFRNLETKYVFTVTAQPKEYQVNDTVTLNTPFTNYFAHDDGSAEWQVFVKFANGGEHMASRFRTNMGDTLRAVQLMFPHVAGDVQNQQFRMKIWIADPATAKPVYESHLLKPFYANNVLDTIHGFTTYRLENISGKETPLFIPPGDFWVGWEQVSAASLGIPVGFDLHNNCNCNFSNINGVWKPFPSSLKGSLMVRPVFGKTAPKNTVNDASSLFRPVLEIASVYPNPTSGILFIDLSEGSYNDYDYQVFNSLGQKLQSGKLKEVLDLPQTDGEMYFLRIRNKQSGVFFNQKIAVSVNKRP